MNKKQIVLVLLAAIGVMAGLVSWFAVSSAPEAETSLTTPSPSGPKKKSPKRAAAKSQPRSALPKKAGKPIKPVLVRADFSGKDLEISERLQTALDAEDFRAVCAAAEQAMKSSNPELRKEALDALGWFGAKALPELTTALADPDAEVAETALSNADSALSGMEDPNQQFGTVSAYMLVLSKNEAALDTFSATLTSSSNTLCTPEDEDNPRDQEQVAKNREMVISALTQMIEAGGKLEECAKETYSFTTGYDWINASEARRWASDPDAYEEPEVGSAPAAD